MRVALQHLFQLSWVPIIVPKSSLGQATAHVALLVSAMCTETERCSVKSLWLSVIRSWGCRQREAWVNQELLMIHAQQCSHFFALVGAGKGEGQDLEMGEGDDDGVLELAPHYQYISGLR